MARQTGCARNLSSRRSGRSARISTSRAPLQNASAPADRDIGIRGLQESVVGREKIIGMIRITLEKTSTAWCGDSGSCTCAISELDSETETLDSSAVALTVPASAIVNPCLYDWFLPMCRPNGKEYAS